MSKLRLNTPEQFRFNPTTGQQDPTQPQVVPEQIADVASYKNAAYLNSWADPTCKRGGFFSVDISDPANPEQIAFVPALPGTYHGEGAHAITLNTASFQGDVLAVNNEPCAQNGVGGFDLYDVTDPADPKPLIQGFGDRSADATTGPFGPLTPIRQVANSAHSIFIWQDGTEAFAVIVDNTEFADTDIFDITNPRQPRFIADVDLFSLAEQQGIDVLDDDDTNPGWGWGQDIFLHDMVVKTINGVPTLLASYWDVGYIKADLSDPSNPRVIGDSVFDSPDPLMSNPLLDPPDPFPLQEGNGHQAEFSHDNRFVLAADEDFDTHRMFGFLFVTANSGAPVYDVGEAFFGAGDGPDITRANPLDGFTRFVGNGCVAGDIPAPTPPSRITAVVERSTACTYKQQVENAESRGYEGVIIMNYATGPEACEIYYPAYDMQGYAGDVESVFVPRVFGIFILGAYDPSTYSCGGAGTPTPAPAVSTDGRRAFFTNVFDGWGYMHLYRNTPTNLTTAGNYAIAEAKDEQFATGAGDLTVHEFATDQQVNLAYSSYYAGGLRVMSFGDQGLVEVGKFIDQGGNNFWGVESVNHPAAGRLIALSDRDFGLYLTRYTGTDGPPAAAPPVCNGGSLTTPVGVALQMSLNCTDVNQNPLTISIETPPANGTLSAIDQATGKVTYTPKAGFAGTDSFSFKATDGHFDSTLATVTVAVQQPPKPPDPQPQTGGGTTTQPATQQQQPQTTTVPTVKAGACANDLLGTAARDLLRGTAAGERMTGGAGNDSMNGNAGDDCLFGEAGNDDLIGGDGNDDVVGGAGRDKLAGGAGDDELDGGTGDDTLDGGAGKDRVGGGTGNDQLIGGAGVDNLRGDAGNDKISARGGGRDRIDCGAGRDRVTADRTDKVARNCERVSRR